MVQSKGTKLGSEDEMEMKFEDSVPFSALAFKVANDPFVGSLTFIRIYSGTIKTGTAVFNSSKEKKKSWKNAFNACKTLEKILKKLMLVILLR